MKLKIMLLLLMNFFTLGVMNSKTTETTLWETTYSGEIELNNTVVSTFAEGDILRVYITVPSGGANFKIMYKGAPNWSETTIPSIGTQWPWVNEGETYKDFVLTAADITALSSMNIYISQSTEYTTSITKVSRITTELDEEALYSVSTVMGDWTTIYENTLTPTLLANVKEGDKLVVNASASSGGQVWIAKLTGDNWAETNLLDGASITTSVSYTLTAEDASIIKERGIRLKGKNFTMSSLGLVRASVKAIIPSTGIGTFCSSKNLDFTSTGVTPYYASNIAKGKVTLTSVLTTASGSGYILQGSEGVYAIPVIAESVSAPSTNYLKATGDNAEYVAASTDGTYHYIFAKNGSDIGFYKLTTDHTLAAHKAYLETENDIKPTTQGAPVLLIFDDNNTTAINAVQERVKEDGVYYNLSGQRVQNPTRGLYIVNGKKYIKH